MATSTSVARHFVIKQAVLIVVCVAFAAWGAFDLWVKIPREDAVATRYQELTEQRETLAAQVERGEVSTDEAVARNDAIESELKALAPDGETPVHAEAFDRAVCWIFIACVLFAPYPLVQLRAARRQVFRLEDDGSFSSPDGSWPADRIKDIDMSRWMAKSIATVEIDDGTRVKLDDYIYRDTAVIVGRLASRFHPEAWTEEAKPVKHDQEQPEDDEAADDGPPAKDGQEG